MKNILIITFILCFFVVNALTADEIPKISLRPDCKTFYAGREQTFTIVTKQLTGENLSWNLRYAGRTLTAGKRKIPQNGIVKINIEFPKLNQGVIAKTEFSCWTGKKGSGNRLSVVGDRLRKENDGEKALGNRGQAIEQEQRTSNINKERGLRRSLYFFYPNPFEGEKKALEARQIGVWEVTDGGSFSKLLKSLEVPFAEVADPEQFNGQVLLVRGIDFDSSPGVLEALLKLAEKGKKIIVLPPILGKIVLPINQLNRFILGENEYIGIMEEGRTGIRSQAIGIRKKFDTENWNGKAVAQTNLKLGISGETLELEFDNPNKGFTYCELRVKKALGNRDQALGKYKNEIQSKGKVIITTWDIVKRAKNSPTPVYLLKELIGR